MDLSPLQLSLSSAQVQKKVSSLAPLLLAWYDQNKRELPWRQDNSALSGVGVRNHAAANARGGGHPLF